jgi:predicted transposase YbfD/YdcC
MSRPDLAIRKHFRKLKDPRVQGRTKHLLVDIITITICGVIGGCNDWQQLETFARARREWFQKFLRLPDGIPAHDTYERLLDRVDPAAFQACFRNWMQALHQALGLCQIAIDGKTLRGSHDGDTRPNALHLVSAWATEARLFLGQIAVEQKSNEITAIPQLLELLDIEGATVTIDAMGCQKEIAAQIVAGGGDYVLALKGNHEHLHAAVAAEFTAAAEADFQVPGLRRHVTVETNRGRRERREYVVMPAPRRLPGIGDWAKLMTIGMVLRTTQTAGKETGEVSYFLSSQAAKVKAFAKVVRGHWSIESQLHWVLDVTFAEDESRIRRQNAPQTSAVLRRLAVSILSQDTTVRDNLRGKRYRACLSTAVLERILLGFAAI